MTINFHLLVSKAQGLKGIVYIKYFTGFEYFYIIISDKPFKPGFSLDMDKVFNRITGWAYSAMNSVSYLVTKIIKKTHE